MTVSSPNVTEIKLDRLIDDMRLLRSQMIAFDRHLKGIEACLKTNEPKEQQPWSKSRPWFAAVASATARTVLFAVGAATGAVLSGAMYCRCFSKTRRLSCDARSIDLAPSVVDTWL